MQLLCREFRVQALVKDGWKKLFRDARQLPHLRVVEPRVCDFPDGPGIQPLAEGLADGEGLPVREGISHKKLCRPNLAARRDGFQHPPELGDLLFRQEAYGVGGIRIHLFKREELAFDAVAEVNFGVILFRKGVFIQLVSWDKAEHLPDIIGCPSVVEDAVQVLFQNARHVNAVCAAGRYDAEERQSKVRVPRADGVLRNGGFLKPLFQTHHEDGKRNVSFVWHREPPFFRLCLPVLLKGVLPLAAAGERGR